MRCPACNAQAPQDADTCGACGHRLAPATVGPGQVIASRYEILSPLGRGGMGMVFKAHDRMLEETVAIKVLRSDVIETPEVARRFRSEIKLARAVSHKNVCRIHEYGEDRGLRFISMAFVDGVDLKQVLRTRGPLPPAEAFDVAIQVADGLQAIHDEGIIHRDLKTPNLMLDRRGVVRLMDFGIAKQWEAGTAASLTAVGQIVGTPEYMSPEQVRAEKLDARSDLYALGVVIYELFSGATPFRAETPIAMIMKQLHDQPPLEGAGAPALPGALIPVLRRALAKNRDDRYASARELADALRQARDATPGATLAGVAHPMAASVQSGTATPTSTPFAITPMPPTTEQTAVSSAAWPIPAPARPPASRVATAAEVSTAATSRTPRLLTALGVGLLVLMVGAAGLVLLVAPWLVQPRPTRPPAVSVPAPPVPTTAQPTPAATPSVSPSLAAPALLAPSPIREARAVTRTPPPPAVLPVIPFGTPAPAASARTPAPQPSAALLEIEGYLAEAESAFAARKYDTALRFYEQVLRLEPQNVRARVGRDLCQQSLAQAPVATAPGRSFVAGQTVSALPAAPAAGPRGFGDAGGVDVRRVDQAAALPAKIAFEIEPASVRAGDPYEARIYLINESASSLQIRDLRVSNTLNGRTSGGTVASLSSEVGPRQKALLFSIRDRWDADARSWALSALVRTTRGDALQNEVAWK